MRVIDANLQTPFDADTQAHIDRMTDKSDGQLLYDLDTLIRGLKADSLWDKIAILCVCQSSSDDSLLNLKGSDTDNDSLEVGSPVFVADRGFTGATGAANYIDLNEDEITSSLYTLYDGHMMFYHRNSLKSKAHSEIGGIVCVYELGVTGYTISHQNGNYSSTTDADGFIGISALASNNRFIRNNDTVTSYTVSASHTLAAGNFLVGKEGSNGNGIQYSSWGIGDGLSSAEMANYENRIKAFMQARGASVY